MKTESILIQALGPKPEHPVNAMFISDRLDAAITEGVLREGALVKQQVIANHFGVSRMPVREAIARVQAKGLLSNVPNKSCRVIFPPQQDPAPGTDSTAAPLDDLSAKRIAKHTEQLEQDNATLRAKLAALMQAVMPVVDHVTAAEAERGRPYDSVFISPFNSMAESNAAMVPVALLKELVAAIPRVAHIVSPKAPFAPLNDYADTFVFDECGGMQ